MQSNPQKLWIPNPSASLVEVGGVGTPFEGEVRLVDQISILQESVRRCDVVCASPCTPEVWTIEFEDIDFGTCNPCGKSLGFKIVLQRHPDFDNQTYFDYAMHRTYSFGEPLQGTWTGAQLASWFYNYIESLKNQNDQHDHFLIDYAVSGSTLTLTLPCSGLLTYNLIGIYQIPNNNLLPAELPVFTLVTKGEEAVLSREKLLRNFPQEVGHVFGEAPRDTFMWCQTICVVKLKGCIDACSDFFDNQNSGHLHTGATPFDLLLYINSAAPGYAAFIQALENTFDACDNTGLSTIPGYQCGVQVLPVASVYTIPLGGFTFSASGTPFTLTLGGLVLNVNATSAVNLATQLSNYFTGTTFGTFAIVGTNLVISDEAGATGNFANLCSPTYRNYVGE
jgi:hypothetical protein